MLLDGIIVRSTSSSSDDDFHTLTATTTIRTNDEFIVWDPVVGDYRKILWEDVVKLIASPTDGNLLQMDADGRAEDSGIAASDVSTAVSNSHAPTTLGTKTLNEAAIADTYVISYDAASGELIYRAASEVESSYVHAIAIPAFTSALTDFVTIHAPPGFAVNLSAGFTVLGYMEIG